MLGLLDVQIRAAVPFVETVVDVQTDCPREGKANADDVVVVCPQRRDGT